MSPARAPSYFAQANPVEAPDVSTEGVRPVARLKSGEFENSLDLHSSTYGRGVI